jgi:peptide deformylase
MVQLTPLGGKNEDSRMLSLKNMPIILKNANVPFVKKWFFGAEPQVLFLFMAIIIGVLLNMTDLYAEEIILPKDIIGTPHDVIRMGHPTLRQKAKEVADPTDPKIQQAIADMLATVNKIGVDQLVGLAAPQINIPLQIFLFQVPVKRVNGDVQQTLPFTVVINPKIEPINEEKELGIEGCLSIPGLVGEVPRYKHIKYTYQTLKGKKITKEAHDFHARVIQHETDHLNGILYLDLMEDIKRLYFAEEFKEYHQAVPTK